MNLNFKEAFISAFEFYKRDFVWTDDGVLRTTVMQSYIFPFIAKYLDLYLICELPADASFFDKNAVQSCLDTGKGYPKYPIIVIEHENKATYSGKEINDLAIWNYPLNVLITYPNGNASDQFSWLSDKFAPKLLTKDDINEYLSILPSPNNGINNKPIIDWWNFFSWNKKNKSFEVI